MRSRSAHSGCTCPVTALSTVCPGSRLPGAGLRAREEVAIRVGAGPQHVGASVRLDAGPDPGGSVRVGLGQRRRRRAEPHRRRDLRRGAGRPLEHDLPAAPHGLRLWPQLHASDVPGAAGAACCAGLLQASVYTGSHTLPPSTGIMECVV